MSVAHLQTGSDGESIACRFLEAKGLTLVERNWRCRAGELDLVMRDGQDLAFIEVKTRSGEQFGSAEEAVTSAKGRRLLQAAEWYVAEHPGCHDLLWRIDLVSVTLGSDGRVVRIHHEPNAIVTG